MTWTLILISERPGRVPAVLPGYKTKEEAMEAGDAALRDCRPARRPLWDRRTIVPGPECPAP